MGVAKAILEPQPHLDPGEAAAAGPTLIDLSDSTGSSSDMALQQQQHPALAATAAGSSSPSRSSPSRGVGGSRSGGVSRAVRRVLAGVKSSALLSQYDSVAFFLQQQQQQNQQQHEGEQKEHASPGGRLSKVAAALAEAPRYLILDFRCGPPLQRL